MVQNWFAGILVFAACLMVSGQIWWSTKWVQSLFEVIFSYWSITVFFLFQFASWKRNQNRYRKVASRSTCYYSENQAFGGATNRDMSLKETCFFSKIQKIWNLKFFFAWISKSFYTWISNPSLLGFQILLCLDFSILLWIS